MSHLRPGDDSAAIGRAVQQDREERRVVGADRARQDEEKRKRAAQAPFDAFRAKGVFEKKAWR